MKNRDGYQVCIGNDDVIEVKDLTEDQAKECLCRYIDLLESVEIKINFAERAFAKWRNVKAPRKR